MATKKTGLKMTTPPDRFKRTKIASLPLPSLAQLIQNADRFALPAPHITFETSAEDAACILEIVKRGVQLWRLGGVELNARMAIMDVTLCHAALHPLDLVKFLTAEQAEFMFDFQGIGEHMERRAGHLLHGFVPRFARPKS